MLVADKRRKEPRTIPRPYETDDARDGVVKVGLHTDGDSMVAVGLDAMLSATQMRGAVRLGD